MSKMEEIRKYYETHKITEECMREMIKITNGANGANCPNNKIKTKPIEIPYSNKIKEKNKYHN